MPCLDTDDKSKRGSHNKRFCTFTLIQLIN
jgi:hypothetical protein